MAVQVVVNGTLGTRNVEPFDCFGGLVTASDQGNGHRHKGKAKQEGKPRRRLGIFLGGGDHQNRGGKRSKDKKM